MKAELISRGKVPKRSCEFQEAKYVWKADQVIQDLRI
jgi:hypothetical protein